MWQIMVVIILEGFHYIMLIVGEKQGSNGSLLAYELKGKGRKQVNTYHNGTEREKERG